MSYLVRRKLIYRKKQQPTNKNKQVPTQRQNKTIKYQTNNKTSKHNNRRNKQIKRVYSHLNGHPFFNLIINGKMSKYRLIHLIKICFETTEL